MLQLELNGIKPAYKIEVFQSCDEMDNPRSWDNLGTMVCLHKRYTLGDAQDIDEVADLIRDWYYDNSPTIDLDEKHNLRDFRVVAQLLEEKLGAILLPIYMYDHSGITINTAPFSCSWDSGQIGFIYALPEQIREWYGVKRITKKIRDYTIEALKSEVKTYDQYLCGDVYGYRLYDSTGNEIETAGDFYGQNWLNNGMADYLPKEAIHLLDNIEVLYE